MFFNSQEIPIRLEIKDGFRCGGYAIFMRICSGFDLSNCCEDQIVPNPNEGYDNGEVIYSTTRNCNPSWFSGKTNFKYKLSSYEEIQVSL